MSQVSLPVTRPIGRALLVSNPAARSNVLQALKRLGYGCAESDDPYAAMAELCRRPMVYRAAIFSLAGLYREELAIIPSIKRRYPHIEVWLAHTDGRQGALAEAMRFGADGLLDDDGLHRIAMNSLFREERADSGAVPDEAAEDSAAAKPGNAESAAYDCIEPILSADELRALLQEQPELPGEQ